MSQITVHVQRMDKGIVSFPGHIFALGQAKHSQYTGMCIVSSRDCMISTHGCLRRAETGLLRVYIFMENLRLALFLAKNFSHSY